MSLYLDDGDVRLYHGDALEQLALMPSESVHCIVTSPPFWGLRDYNEPRQIGLEETPDEWCTRLVTVMREARRVLRADGVMWLEVGDSYAGSGPNTNAGFNERNGHAPGQRKQEQASSRKMGLVPASCKPKDLVGAPWLLAFALRADGWYLRSDTIWARPNPMPESVTDRPTKAHSYVFLLTKSARYFYDADAIREGWTDERNGASGATRSKYDAPGAMRQDGGVTTAPQTAGRNARSVWSIATEPTPFAHFATFPTALVERCIKAGTSEHGCCSECGAPWRRVTEKVGVRETKGPNRSADAARPYKSVRADGTRHGSKSVLNTGTVNVRETTGWEPSCICVSTADLSRRIGVVPCVVLDPFMGSGTTALVARRLGRNAIGIDLSLDYLAISAKRLEQLSLFHSTEAQSGPATANSQES